MSTLFNLGLGTNILLLVQAILWHLYQCVYKCHWWNWLFSSHLIIALYVSHRALIKSWLSCLIVPIFENWLAFVIDTSLCQLCKGESVSCIIFSFFNMTFFGACAVSVVCGKWLWWQFLWQIRPSFTHHPAGGHVCGEEGGYLYGMPGGRGGGRAWKTLGGQPSTSAAPPVAPMMTFTGQYASRTMPG